MIDYPLILNLEHRNVLVVGGGRVATRRVPSLIDSGAEITVVSEEASKQIQAWAKQGCITWGKRRWERKDSDGPFLIIAATDDERVNEKIAACAQPNQLVCVSGHAQSGNVSVPAVMRRGRLTVAVSTGGASPYFAGQLRDAIDRNLEGDYGAYMDFLFLVRRQVLSKKMSRAQKMACLKQALNPKYLDQSEQQKFMNHLTYA
ncbi:siroheme synthase [Sporolactobacillus sp. CPB3-1]|uniref:precorrin-2 dehydrogenase n=1 Tax=Sporolactobacillus mangiferae TaxID=2940498 RepID=A0ABT0MDF3_9BACL|nr:NAD(P)-dependent oxidoreductase [Sporolactobacillus mangiferae]MCL1632895.1 siroheme synthase [Sporolactobacillus mangiferae]